MSKVYLVAADRSDPEGVIADKLEVLWRAAGLDACFHPKDLTALKLHVGEPGRKTFVSPAVVAALVRLIAGTGARPFLTDTSVLYKSRRDNGVDHARVAIEHGFGMDRVGAPFIPADGLNGSDEVEVSVGGRHYDKVSIASGILHARSMLVLSHATGHMGTGLGGALKNIGMGCSSKKAKLRQHHGQQPRIDPEKCTACGTCAAWCPSDSIRVDKVAEIDPGTCIGCGECVAVCLDDAVIFDWSVMGPELQERVVEHAAAVVRSMPERIACVTVATNITKDCDCIGEDRPPVMDDIGILASLDPVAIDRAVLDLVRERTGRTLESLSYPENDGTHQIRYAESMGLGSGTAEVVPV